MPAIHSDSGVAHPEEEADLFVSDTDERQCQTDHEDREQREREQQEREQQEREQQEREQQGREQQEREQQEREQQEREQQEREQQEREQQEREQRQREQRQQEQRQREQRQQEQRQQEQQEQEQQERERRKIKINLARWEDNTWKPMPPLSVDSENPAIVKETIETYMIQRVRAFNTDLLMMAPDAYFQAVINDRTHTILLVPQDNLSIDNKMIESAAKLREEAIKNVIGLKRTAPDDLPETDRPLKIH
ncbi:hypothetical protein OIDMADRAFT_48715 [Oidiodendron maius Zn]|uniref:Uncharacterized protein n=1 Tax=Oidiodendron maius (strain Zn) TaxID=913774 RepID=A0A0C3E3E2_OIDMZ|nr:hypothetical protein OIDMADRAFT_48715 [Oidiodendron maius Zn]